MDIFKGLFFFTIFLNSFLSFSQEKSELSQLSFDALTDSIDKYGLHNLTKAVEATQVYILKAQEKKDKIKQWKGVFSLGSIYERHQEFNKAQEYYEQSLAIAKENNFQEEVVGSYILGASIQLALSNASKALDLLEKALELAEEIDNEYYKEAASQYMTYALQISGDTQKAIEIRKKNILFYENKTLDSAYSLSVKKEFLVPRYYQLSNSYLKIKQVDSAKHYVDLISKMVTRNDSCNQRTLYLAQGQVAFYEKDYSQAKSDFLNAFQLCDPNDPLEDLRMNYDLGKVEHGSGNFKAARDILQKGLDDYDVKPSEEGFMDNYYKLLADSYKETGDFERANYYFEKYIFSTSEFDKFKTELKATTKAKEISKFRQELEKMEAEKEEKQTLLNYLLLAASLIILTLLFVLLRFYKNKKKNEIRFQELLEKMKHSSKEDLDIIDTKDEVLEETNSSDVSEEVKTQILEGLKKLEKQEYFLRQDCSSYNVAKKIGTNTSYLSKVINNHYGKNFNTYINDLRINYAILRLKNDVIFRSYSIQSIAEEVGYKSADSFTRYFKKDTGLNPSFYIKEIKNMI